MCFDLISPGDYEVAVDGKNFTCESGPKSIQIKFPRNNIVKISGSSRIWVLADYIFFHSNLIISNFGLYDLII